VFELNVYRDRLALSVKRAGLVVALGPVLLLVAPGNADAVTARQQRAERGIRTPAPRPPPAD
jgi:hypothetical protein